MVRLNKVTVVETLFLFPQLSFGVNGGVQQVILACTITLEFNSSWLMMDLATWALIMPTHYVIRISLRRSSR